MNGINQVTTDPRSDSDWLAGGGEMGQRIRSMDWSTTPLGPMGAWPQSLRSAVRMVVSSRFPMFVWWGDSLVNLYNDAYVPILGQRHPDALGRPAKQIWSEIWPTLGPQTELVVNEGRATWNEELLLLMERNRYLEETYFTFSYSPAHNDDGSVGGVFCACTEDTERVLGERRLRTLRAMAEETVGAASAEEACRLAARVAGDNPHDHPYLMVYLLDSDKRVKLAGISGLEPDTVASPVRIDLDDPDTPWPFATVFETGERIEIHQVSPKLGELPGGAWPESPKNAVILPLAGSTQGRPTGFVVAGISPRRPMNDSYLGFLDLMAGQIAGAVRSARTVEEERKRAEALAELDRAKTAFFSNVSHEFRTPLTLMLGPLKDARDDTDDALSEKQRERLDVAYRNSLRLLKLVNSLLDFSRIEAGRIQAVYEPTDLAAFTAELASSFRSACDSAGLELTVDAPPLPEAVYVDRDMWEKVVLNLLSNAFKFTLEGSIEVRIRAVEGQAELTVRDTGVGIPPEEMPKLFERFHRVEGTRGRTQEGSGIGLALVQELVRLHGGEVSADSEPGKGTSFRVRIRFGTEHLPEDRIGGESTTASTALSAAAFVGEALRWLPGGDPESGNAATFDEPMKSSLAGSPVRTQSAGESRPRILWADDNADMRDYVYRLLRRDYDVTAVGDGRAALQAARMDPPDRVLTDIMMPQLDGFGLLAELRADERTRELPVILLSARAGEEARVEGMEAGADDYLTKPFTARELMACVASHLTLAKLRLDVSEKLRESEARFRHLADSAPVIIWMTDIEGECVYLNRRWFEFTGTTGAQDWLDSLHPDDRGRVDDEFRAARESQERVRLEYRLRRHDGDYRWAVDTAEPRFGADGEFLGHVGSVIDVTDMKRTEVRLKEADRRKDVFLAMLAHELRNPLAPIRTGLEILKLSTDDREAADRTRLMMERQVQQMVRLIDDLLDVSRITRNKLELRKSRIDLAEVVRTAVEAARPAIGRSGHELTCELPERPIFLHADPTRLSQVISNLLDNAAKFTPEGGSIELEVQQAGDGVDITVTDSGIGIPADELESIFEMFSQVDDEGEHSSGGLGIGLTLVRSLVEMHGGRVTVSSDGPGRGSTFRVRLPLSEQFAGEEDPAGQAQVAARPGRRILVVDDNEDAADGTRMMLELLGNEVRTAYDGLQALTVATEFEPEVVLLDLGMPRLDGFETARRLREAPWAKDLLLVALTGWGQDEDKRRCEAAGFDHHLTKPVEPDALRSVLAD